MKEGLWIEFEIGHPKTRFGRGPLAPVHEDFEPRQELGKCVWLDQVIVTPGTQTAHSLVDLAECADDQYRRVFALVTQTLDQRQAIQGGQHSVHDQGVVVFVQSAVESTCPVLHYVGHVAAFPKRFAEVVGGDGIVFNNQNFHPSPACLRRE